MVTPEQVNKAYQDIFFSNQRRVNVKLSSQNHVMKTEDEECENLGGSDFKEEAESSQKKNLEYYSNLGLKQETIDNMKTFHLSNDRYAFRKKEL